VGPAGYIFFNLFALGRDLSRVLSGEGCHENRPTYDLAGAATIVFVGFARAEGPNSHSLTLHLPNGGVRRFAILWKHAAGSLPAPMRPLRRTSGLVLALRGPLPVRAAGAPFARHGPARGSPPWVKAPRQGEWSRHRARGAGRKQSRPVSNSSTRRRIASNRPHPSGGLAQQPNDADFAKHPGPTPNATSRL